MPIIRNPYIQVLGGVSWNITASNTIPTSPGKSGDIVLVFPEDATPPNVKTIKQVGVNNNLVESDGNIYGDNGVFLFSALNGTVGTGTVHLVNNRTLDINMNLSNSVVNIDGMQVECDAYVWDSDSQLWVKATYQRLPLVVKETLYLKFWASKGVPAEGSIWGNLGLEENCSTYQNTNVHTIEDNLDLSVWATNGITLTSIQLWTKLTPTDSGTITINDTPTPF